MTARPPQRRRSAVVGLVVAATLSMLATACGSSAGGSANGVTTITLEGPNQWNTDSKSFGKPWEDLVAAFEKKEPSIKVKTVVLPLSTFAQTTSTQLSAGTAPELVFNQAPHEPYMVHPLDDYLKKPNPYVPGNKQWIDLFKPESYGFGNSRSIDAQGHIDFVPFNLTSVGLYVNGDAMAKAGVTTPVQTFGDLITDCGKLKSAGYIPLAMDSSDLGPQWTWQVIAGMLLDRYYNQFNVFAPKGGPGTAPEVTTKSITKAVLTGQLDATKTPEVIAGLKLYKQLWDACVDKNWAGTQGDNGAVVGLRDFAAGKAGMAWGVNFGLSVLSDVPFKLGAMAFPTITKQDSALSTGTPARWGTGGGGTWYMIPAQVKGKQLAATIKFLQFVSSPANVQPWLAATGGIPAVQGATGSDKIKAFTAGAWGEPIRVDPPNGPKAVKKLALYQGYLIGNKSLSEEQSYLEGLWVAGAKEQVKKNGWSKEPWASATP